MHPLPRMILATICYYDVLEFPLTSFELWRYLTFEDPDIYAQYRVPHTLRDVLDAVTELCRDGRVRCVDGFYVLPGREHLVAQRRERTVVACDKIIKMRRAIRIMRYIPFVRMVWITGRLAMKNAEAGSDWDVLVVLREGKIWTGRFMATIVLHLCGLRRTDAHHADRVCLNYFITTNALSISLDDRYSAHEYMMARSLFASISPERFLAANAWIGRFRPHYDAMILPSPLRIPDTAWTHFVRRCAEWVCGAAILERWMRTLQREHIMRNPKTFAQGSMIVANDHELIFLPEPHSPVVLARYHALCAREGLRACA